MTGKWLTPDNPPEHKMFVRRIFIPAEKHWLALVDGALNELTKPYNWEQFGDLTADEAAAAFDDIYQQYIENANEPPEWETPDDIDGQPQQPWYEALEDWIIAGFLAVTFTPGAAMVYQSTVPKLRVAIRTGNLGALFRVLINGVEQWTGDSYAPITDLLTHDFDTSAYEPPFTVRVEHIGQSEAVEGDAKLEVVRTGELWSVVQTILRADPVGCGVQWSTDDGDTWNTVDLSGCIAAIAGETFDTKLQQAIEDGVIAQPTNQGDPSQPPSPGTCLSQHVTLLPGSTFLFPVPVSEGDTITVSNVVGGWSIGEPQWYCPDGYRYLLGLCDHDNYSIVAEDPMPDVRHMQLIGQVGETYFDALTEPYVVPAGVSGEPLNFLANTSLTGAPSGNATFDVEVCTPEGGAWTYHFQFASGEHGFIPDAAENGCASPYTSGAWHNCTHGSYSNVFIRPPFWDVDAFHLTGVRIKGHQGALRNDSGYPLVMKINGSTFVNLSTYNAVGDFDETWTGDYTDTKLSALILCTSFPVDSWITDIYISGVGFNPYFGQ